MKRSMNRNNTCPRCQQPLTKKRVVYLKRLRNAVMAYHAERFRDGFGSFDPTLEIVVRIDGEVVELIPPEAFATLCPEPEF